MPATSWILTDDSLKLSFSTLTKVPFLIFWYDEHPWHANPAHIGCIRDGKWTAWAEIVRQWGVSCVNEIYIFEILMKNCSKYLAKSDDFFLKVGTLTGTFFIVLWEAWLKLFIFCQSPWKIRFLRRLKYLYIKKYIRFICILKVPFHSIRICKIVQSSTFYLLFITFLLWEVSLILKLKKWNFSSFSHFKDKAHFVP